MAARPELTRLGDAASAKINLTLHVRGRRTDGYHDIESLVVFADVADQLTLDPDKPFELAVVGPTAHASGALEDNLVAHAALKLAHVIADIRTGAFCLTKQLPAAAGIGGGSADAAATLRLLACLNGISLDDPRLMKVARELGADVPVCLESKSRMMRGVGEILGPEIKLPPLNAVLVNPGVAVETRAVFHELGFAAGEMRLRTDHPEITSGLSQTVLLAALAQGRNDLELAAIRVCPVIADVLGLLGQQNGVQLARMSGSGGTCFAIFETMQGVFDAVRALRRQRGNWWIQPSVIQ